MSRATSSAPRDERVDAKFTFVVHGGEVLAIFRAIRDPKGKWQKETPYIDGSGRAVLDCYAHVGQHGTCCPEILWNCRRAKPEEYLPLKRELEEIIGYNVETVQHGKLCLREETGYAACWLDELENPDAGIYRVFRKRSDALDFLVDAVFDRARGLGVDVIDMEGYEGMRDEKPRKMTPDEVRDALADGSRFTLGLEFDSFRTATRRTAMWVEEVTVG